MKALTDSRASLSTTRRTISVTALPKIIARDVGTALQRSRIRSPMRLLFGAAIAMSPSNRHSTQPLVRCSPAFHSSRFDSGNELLVLGRNIDLSTAFAAANVGARKKTHAITTEKNVIA